MGRSPLHAHHRTGGIDLEANPGVRAVSAGQCICGRSPGESSENREYPQPQRRRNRQHHQISDSSNEVSKCQPILGAAHSGHVRDRPRKARGMS